MLFDFLFNRPQSLALQWRYINFNVIGSICRALHHAANFPCSNMEVRGLPFARIVAAPRKSTAGGCRKCVEPAGSPPGLAELCCACLDSACYFFRTAALPVKVIMIIKCHTLYLRGELDGNCLLAERHKRFDFV